MRNVPDYAKVPKEQYRELRKELESVCNLFSFEFHDVWDIMIGKIEARHERVLAGKAKAEMRLDLAVEAMANEVRKERKRREDEAVQRSWQTAASKTVAMMNAVNSEEG
jgi:hypothetical protein